MNIYCPICGEEYLEDGLCVNGHSPLPEKSKVDRIKENLDGFTRKFLDNIDVDSRKKIEDEMEMIAKPVEDGFEVTIVMDSHGLMMIAQLRAMIRDELQNNPYVAITPMGIIEAKAQKDSIDRAMKILATLIMSEGGGKAIDKIEEKIEEEIKSGIARKIMNDMGVKNDERDTDDWTLGV